MRPFVLTFALVFTACTSSGHDDDAKSCTLLGCEDSVGLARDLTIAEADVGKYTLTICRNGSCASGKIGASSQCELKGDLQPRRCSLARAPMSSMVTLTVSIPAYGAQDGDEYTVKLVNDVTGAAPVDVKSKVTYTTSQPNGPGCDPTCKSASL